MKVVDIANEIFVEIGRPSSTSVPAISFWVRAKVGEINNLLFESFVFNDSYEIVDGNGNEISREAVAIIKKLYKVHDFDLQIRSNMASLLTDSVLEVVDQGSSVKRVNKNEINKTYASMKNEEQKALNDLITSYRLRLASPTQVVGDDTIPGVYGETSYNDLRVWQA